MDAKQIADQNIGLLFAFVRDFCVGNKRDLISDLSLAYMDGVDAFAKSDASSAVSTYIYHALRWEMSRIKQKIGFHKRLIHVCRFNQKTESIRERAKAAVRIFHFHGREGKCNDPSLLHYDDHDAAIMSVAREKVVERLLRGLTYRQRIIVEMRFGFGDGDQYSYRQVGIVLGLTKERVRQIESKAIRLIKERFDKYCKGELIEYA